MIHSTRIISLWLAFLLPISTAKWQHVHNATKARHHWNAPITVPQSSDTDVTRSGMKSFRVHKQCMLLLRLRENTSITKPSRALFNISERFQKELFTWKYGSLGYTGLPKLKLHSSSLFYISLITYSMTQGRRKSLLVFTLLTIRRTEKAKGLLYKTNQTFCIQAR